MPFYLTYRALPLDVSFFRFSSSISQNIWLWGAVASADSEVYSWEVVFPELVSPSFAISYSFWALICSAWIVYVFWQNLMCFLIRKPMVSSSYKICSLNVASRLYLSLLLSEGNIFINSNGTRSLSFLSTLKLSTRSDAGTPLFIHSLTIYCVWFLLSKQLMTARKPQLIVFSNSIKLWRCYEEDMYERSFRFRACSNRFEQSIYRLDFLKRLPF